MIVLVYNSSCLKKIDVITSQDQASRSKTYLERYIDSADFQESSSELVSSQLECSIRCSKLADCGSFKVIIDSGINTCKLGSSLPEAKDTGDTVYLRSPCPVLKIDTRIELTMNKNVSGEYTLDEMLNGRPSFRRELGNLCIFYKNHWLLDHCEHKTIDGTRGFILSHHTVFLNPDDIGQGWLYYYDPDDSVNYSISVTCKV